MINILEKERCITTKTLPVNDKVVKYESSNKYVSLVMSVCTLYKRSTCDKLKDKELRRVCNFISGQRRKKRESENRRPFNVADIETQTHSSLRSDMEL